MNWEDNKVNDTGKILGLDNIFDLPAFDAVGCVLIGRCVVYHGVSDVACVAIADLTQGLWQGGRGMRIMTVAFALGTALVLCNLGTFNAAAYAREAKVVREPRVRLIVRVPVVTPTPWDYYIVPRYRYRPEDDRVDPCGPPVVPVIRYGAQEATVPLWLRDALGLGRVHGVSWPCAGSMHH